MNKVLLSGIVLAMAAVAMFVSAPSWAAESLPGIAQVVRYKEHNACEGQSACKNGASSCKGSCKGHNECRSEGCSKMTAQECNQAQAGGTYEKNTAE